MSTIPTPVQIVRPKTTGAAATGTILGAIAGWFLRALFVWWLTPEFWDGFTLTYWQTLALVVVVHFLTINDTSYLRWTSEAKR